MWSITGLVPFKNDNSRVHEMKLEWLKEWIFIDRFLLRPPELFDHHKVVGYDLPAAGFLSPAPNKFGILPASLLVRFPRRFSISLQPALPKNEGNGFLNVND